MLTDSFEIWYRVVIGERISGKEFDESYYCGITGFILLSFSNIVFFPIACHAGDNPALQKYNTS
jgi:hypothetical protein